MCFIFVNISSSLLEQWHENDIIMKSTKGKEKVSLTRQKVNLWSDIVGQLLTLYERSTFDPTLKVNFWPDMEGETKRSTFDQI